jgi:hypothetical protein
MVDIGEKMMSLLGPVVSAMEVSSAALAEVESLTAPTVSNTRLVDFQQGSIPAALVQAIDFKIMICNFVTLVVDNGEWFFFYMVVTLFFVFNPILMLGCCSACCPSKLPCPCGHESWLWLFVMPCGRDNRGNCYTGLLRVALVTGTLSIVIIFWCSIIFLFLNPLSMVVGDLTLLLWDIRAQGAMHGFPGGPPAICGAQGSSSAFIETAGTQMENAMSSLCTATRQLCTTTIPKMIQPSCCISAASDYDLCNASDVCILGVSPDQCCNTASTHTASVCCPVMQPLVNCPAGMDYSESACATENVTKVGGFAEFIYELKAMTTTGNLLFGCTYLVFAWSADAPRLTCLTSFFFPSAQVRRAFSP